MALTYDYMESVSRLASSLSGQYLARNQQSLARRAFLAADLRSGAKVLTEPTRQQAALLCRVSASSVYWAEKRGGQRWLIENGFVPLVPAAPAARVDSNALAITNGSALVEHDPGLRLADLIGLDDGALKYIANVVRPDRMIAAATAIA